MEQKPSLQARSDGVSIDPRDRLRDQSRDYFHRFMPVTCHVALPDSGHVLPAQGKLSFRVRRASFVLLPPTGQSALANVLGSATIKGEVVSTGVTHLLRSERWVARFPYVPDVTVANYSAVNSLGQWNELRDSKDLDEFHTLLLFN